MKEQQNLEWKESWRDEYLRWICGFANAEGGVLVIGRNDQGRAVGVTNAGRLLEEILNKARDVLGIMVEVNLRHEDGKELLEIRVEPYPSPVSYKGEYHYRSGSTKQELKGAALSHFLLKKQSVISYLTARPSRDLLVAARQEATREWWGTRGTLFRPLISSLVLEEVSAGDAAAALQRLEVCRVLEHLNIGDDCRQLAARLIADKVIPANELEDAVHIALATVARVDFIATWNFAHMVAPAAKYRLQSHIERLGYTPPLLATPEELLETLS